MGLKNNLDLYEYMDLAQDVVAPMMLREQYIDSAALTLGYAGVYSSFLLHTYNAAKKFDLNPRDILVELGKRRMVGGQEDMIIDVSHALKYGN
ncbi:4-hydroxy-2-oxovalerate aldolase [Salmonella enterica]|nr:4-hydroxy-2-oxovalerate aldolase [Salmonella enterica]